MSVFDAPDYDEHEEVVFIREPAVGLRAIVAIHNTRRGPALGGVRMRPYASEAEALRDVLRLSRGMTYKAATLGVNLGGGKSVVFGDPRADKTPEMFQALGKRIAQLGARYIAGEDIGTNPLDMKQIRVNTRCVSCLLTEDGGYGDPAPLTALGVFSAIRAGLVYAKGSDDLSGLRVAVQGVGNVGFNLCRLLREAGAELTVCDAYADAARKAAEAFGCAVVEPAAIYDVDADVFAPCAVGAVLNDDSVARLKVSVVAGAANNQLEADSHARLLADRAIVYLPDYVANGGGLISCAAEWYRVDPADLEDQVRGIYDTCRDILKRADETGVTTQQAADAIAEASFRDGPAG